MPKRFITQHVVKNGDGWAVRKGGSSRITSRFSTQSDAITAATTISKNQGAELFVHGRNGQIRLRNSYGNDSFPPRG